MEGPRFDCLTRRLAGTASRRQMLRTLAVTGVAAGLTRIGAPTALAADVGTAECIGLRQKCKRRKECCGGGRRDCDQVSSDCDKKRLKNGTRCCGTEGAPCGTNSCFCCKGLTCGQDGRCENQ
jgi:hypothetical protein